MSHRPLGTPWTGNRLLGWVLRKLDIGIGNQCMNKRVIADIDARSEVKVSRPEQAVEHQRLGNYAPRRLT